MILISSLGLMTSAAFMVKYSTGKTDSTGSPGENTCASCHSGGSGTTITNVSFNPSVTSGSYTPNQTYTITVNVTNNSYTMFSFACELLNSSTLSNAGTMSNPGTGVHFLTGSNGRNVATHSTPKSGTGSASFTFEWTAPASGNVMVYAIGNAVNGTGGTGGDKPSSTFTLSLSPDLTSVPLNHSFLSSLLIFPNPLKDVANIQFHAAQSYSKLTLNLMNLNGKTLTTYTYDDIQAGLNSLSLRIPSDIPNGLYLIKLSSDAEAITKMILVQR